MTICKKLFSICKIILYRVTIFPCKCPKYLLTLFSSGKFIRINAYSEKISPPPIYVERYRQISYNLTKRDRSRYLGYLTTNYLRLYKYHFSAYCLTRIPPTQSPNLRLQNNLEQLGHVMDCSFENGQILASSVIFPSEQNLLVIYEERYDFCLFGA